MTDALCCKSTSHYYVLVLTGEEQDKNRVQDRIENTCQHFIPVTALVLHTAEFTTWLLSGHAFAHTVNKMALLLYGENDTKNITLTVSEEGINAARKNVYTQGISKAGEFLAGAELFMIRKQNRLAAFMLHQAAEQALQTMLESGTGLHVVTHNIDKLLRYCAMVCYQLPEVFDGNNEKSKHLLSLLQKAYIGARYSSDYVIHTGELVLLMEKVMQ